MNFYLTQTSARNWSVVESGPHASKAAVKAAAMKTIESASSAEDLAILESLCVMASTKRVGLGKSLRNDWIAAHNELTESEDRDIRAAISRAESRCNREQDTDEFSEADMDAELEEFTEF